MYLDRQGMAAEGHEHHLRAINRIAAPAASARPSSRGLLTSGVMYECVRSGGDLLPARLRRLRAPRAPAVDRPADCR